MGVSLPFLVFFFSFRSERFQRMRLLEKPLPLTDPLLGI